MAGWQGKLKALGTRLDFSAAFRPQTDGRSERTIQTLENMIRMCVMDFGGQWDLHLPLIEFVFNNSYHVSIEWCYTKQCMRENADHFGDEKVYFRFFARTSASGI